jgi:hypothetical protein
VSEASARQQPDVPDPDTPVDLEALTEEILPALIARLRASRLGELEVRSDGWRVRLRRDGHAPRRLSRAHAGDGGSIDTADGGGAGIARSSAVGYFSPSSLLIVGQEVQAGDGLGSVDVLGIAHDVSAPISGIVSNVLAEPGQAVEYGQALAEIDPLDDEAQGADVEQGAPPAATDAATASAEGAP